MKDDSSRSDVFHHLGQAYIAQGRVEIAVDCFEQAVAATSWRLEHVESLVLARLTLDRATSALALLNIIEERYVDGAEKGWISYLKAACHAHLGDVPQMRECLRRSKELGVEPASRTDFGKLFSSHGDVDEVKLVIDQLAGDGVPREARDTE